MGREGRRGGGAEIEHRAPRVIGQKLGCDHASNDSADRISDSHDRDAEVAPPRVRELRRHGVGGREHAANAKAGEHAPRRQTDETGRRRRQKHSDHHHRQTPQHRRPAADAVGHAAEHRRSDRHAEQLHRQHDAERRAIDVPLGGDAR